jgi:CRP-like cAMP-binding protein
MPLRSLEVLARCPLFAPLHHDDLGALAAVATTRRYEMGEMLFLAGEKPEGLNIITVGQVKIFVISEQTGREVILTVEYPYNAVAELPSLDGGTYPANAQAVEVTEVLFLEQGAFLGVLHERPEVSLHLVRTLGKRLRRLVNLVEQLSFQEVVHRLAGYLLERAVPGLPLELEANATIAARLGTVPELVSRNLSRLHQSGVIALAQRRVTRIDYPLLRELAESAKR